MRDNAKFDGDPIYWLEHDNICKFLTFDQAEQWGVPLLRTDIEVRLGNERTAPPSEFKCNTKGTTGNVFRYNLITEAVSESGSQPKEIAVEFEQWQCIGFAFLFEDGFSHVLHHPFALLDPEGAAEWNPAEYGWECGVYANRNIKSRIPILTFTPTIAGQALILAAQLSYDFATEAEDALILLFTDALPRRSPIQARYSARMVYKRDGEPDYLAHGPITLFIDPYVPAESVLRAYREMQRQIFGGRDCRLPKADNLDWYAFATETRRKRPLRWPQLYAKWRGGRGEENDGQWRPRHKTMKDIRKWLLPMSFWATAFKYWNTDAFKAEEAIRKAKGIGEVPAQLITGTPDEP